MKSWSLGATLGLAAACAATLPSFAPRALNRLVTLDPGTKYSREWFRRFGADPQRFDVPAPDPLFIVARKLAVADAEGRFWFTRLRAGNYLVRSSVTRDTISADSGLAREVLAALVALQEGDRNELVLHQFYTPDSAWGLGVVIVTEKELSARRFRVISRVSGTSFDSPPNEESARADLTLNAKRKGAAIVWM